MAATKHTLTSALLNSLQVSVPFEELRTKLLDLVLSLRINPEIVIGHGALDRFAPSDYADLARQLKGAGLRATVHAPFLDLRPGALDPVIRQISFERIQRCLEVSEFFRPTAIICHHAFDEKYYAIKKEAWRKNSITFWSSIIAFLPANTRIALENVYETSPNEIKEVLDAVGSERLRFCFDIGHCNCFARGNYEDWVNTLGDYLTDLHIHNNYGGNDEHLSPLEGTFPFTRFVAYLRMRGVSARVTLEAHGFGMVEKSLRDLETTEINAVLLEG